MEAMAKVTHVRIAPRKVQIVLDLIRNQPLISHGNSQAHAQGRV